MRKLLPVFLMLLTSSAFAQSLEVDVFQKTATGTTATIGVRVRATGAPVNYIGLTFYILYQSANAAPQSTAFNSVVGVDDSKLVTTFAWGSSARFTNPQQTVTVDPGAPGGQVFDRRYVYGNIDENGGASVQTATAAWDTLLYITLNTLQPVYPQGGYAYQQASSETLNGAAFSDANFANIPFAVNSGNVALGLNVTPVTFSKYDVKCSERGTSLSWTTAFEQNSSYFEVEKSANGTGSDWKSIGRISAAGLSGTQKNYQYLDLEAGTAAYRIKQVDQNGRAVYTDVKRSSCQSTAIDVALYPIPANDKLTVAIRSGRAVRTNLQVIDAAGRIVYKLSNAGINIGNNNIQLDVRSLPAGNYILVSSDPSVYINQKFIIAR